MAGPEIVPMTLSAKVLKSPTKVPSLTAKPFEKDKDDTLQPGVHLHWALPDGLTQARVRPERAPGAALFPAIPDLWLVVRFNTVIQKFGEKRAWLAWVVDSRAGTVTPVEQWKPPSGTPPKTIHTAAGFVPSAAELGMPGWGMVDATAGEFDPLTAAYYPACRERLGFHDQNVASNGKVAYTVIGWSAAPEQDPLAAEDFREELLETWRFAHHTRAHSFDELTTPVSAEASGAWQLGGIQTATSTWSTEKMQAAVTAASELGSVAQRSARLQAWQQAFPAPSKPRAVTAVPVNVIAQEEGLKGIRCQGSIIEVDLAGPATQSVVEKVNAYPSVKRGMAEMASSKGTDGMVDVVEMLLQDLDHQKGTAAGVVDLPGAVHALSFQSAAGASHWHARIELYPFSVVTWALEEAFYESGIANWPQMPARSASSIHIPDISHIPPELLRTVTADQLEKLTAEILSAFGAAMTALPKEKSLDDRLVQVVDYRSDAQTPALGAMPAGQGSDGAASWLDISDGEALEEFLKTALGAVVHLPDVDNLLEVPGPRWYRPWSPQVALFSAERSYKFGFDGRFTADGFTATRMSGEMMSGLAVGDRPVALGADLLDRPDALFSVAGLPAETRALVNEALLWDVQSAGAMSAATARRGASEAELEAGARAYRAGILGMYIARSPSLSQKQKAALEKFLPYGEAPSPVAATHWKDPRDPLFVDVNYSHPYSSAADNWRLAPDEVEMSSGDPPSPGTVPPEGQVIVFEERSPVTATVAKVLDSALVTKKSLDAAGGLTESLSPPEGVDKETFKKLDVVSAPLTGFDASLVAQGRRERTGALRVNQLDLVDLFGIRHPWSSGQTEDSPAGDPTWPHWTPLSPRLPYWARLQFRLQAAANPQEEASAVHTPICGILLPDLLEHALEVFDGDGKAIGQIWTDRPGFGAEFQAAATLGVHFELHPWVAAELGRDPAEAVDAAALTALENEGLRSFVDSLLSQSTDVPVPAVPEEWYETGLTALLRVVDTVRSTLDPSVQTRDRKVRLLGEPILLLSARVALEGTSTTDPQHLKNPAPLDASAPLPAVTVRIGDVTRPDDGVLGCFVRGDTQADGRFAPVSEDAATKALLDRLGGGYEGKLGEPEPADHEFVNGQVSEFRIQPGEERPLLVLADVRGGLYATSGVLPRKKISLPKEFVEPALRRMEPTFRVGPVMTTRRRDALVPLLPPPQIEGYVSELVYADTAEGGATSFPEAPVPPVLPVAELPAGRVILDEGWLRMVQHQAGAAPPGGP